MGGWGKGKKKRKNKQAVSVYELFISVTQEPENKPILVFETRVHPTIARRFWRDFRECTMTRSLDDDDEGDVRNENLFPHAAVDDELMTLPLSHELLLFYRSRIGKSDLGCCPALVLSRG
jgi:hypothetical protein